MVKPKFFKMMKKVFLLVIISAFLISTESYAQDLGLNFGIKGGVQLTNLYVDDVHDENSKVGFQGGLYFKNQITDFFALQPEILYSLKGSELEYDNVLFGSGSYRYNLGYIEVPVLAVVSVGPISVHAGPYIAFLTNANIKDVDDDGDIDEIAELDRDDFNTVDYGIAAGVGLDFLSGTLGLRYNYGLNEIGKDDIAGELTKNSKNSVLSLYVGIHF